MIYVYNNLTNQIIGTTNKVINIQDDKLNGDTQTFILSELYSYLELEKEYAVGDILTNEDLLTPIKISKIKELNEICHNTIVNGFVSNVKGAERLYDFNLENQNNMESIKNAIRDGLITDGTLLYYAKGGSCEIYTNEEFFQLHKEGFYFKFSTIQKYKQLKEQVEKSNSEEEINTIVW